MELECKTDRIAIRKQISGQETRNTNSKNVLNIKMTSKSHHDCFTVRGMINPFFIEPPKMLHRTNYGSPSQLKLLCETLDDDMQK